MVLHAVILHTKTNHLEAVVEDQGKLHRVGLSWFDLKGLLPGGWFASIVGEVQVQQSTAAARAQGKGRLF